MKLSILDPRFIKLNRTDEKWSYSIVDKRSEADGVIFLCPVHFQKNKGKVGTHSVICWFKNRNIPAGLSPGPGRWDATGELSNLTLSPSVDLGNGDWHGHITNGEVT